jgi:polysaccharide export outer membrane protein
MLVSCATFPASRVKNIVSENKSAQQTAREPSDYLLGPGDVVRITVEQHPEWSGEFTIDYNGEITVSGLGRINANEQTRDDFADIFQAWLEEYIQKPKVSVEIVRFNSEVIYVLGDVNMPGRFPTEGKRITLRDAIINAGLPRVFAATGRVFVISAAKTRAPKRQVINLYRVLYRGELEHNIVINPGDIVYVPKTILGAIVDFLNGILNPLNGVSNSRTAALAGAP